MKLGLNLKLRNLKMLLTKQHLVNIVDDRWETEGEYDLRIRELKAKKDTQAQKELELLAKLKKKYEN